MKIERGFTLIEIAIGMVILSLLLGATLNIAGAVRTNRSISQTRDTLERVEEALRRFVAENNRLPCPAVATLPDDDANYGREAANPGVCLNTTEVLEAEHAGLKTEAAALRAEAERLRTALEAAQDEVKTREADAVRLAAERDAAQAQTQALLRRIGQPT